MENPPILFSVIVPTFNRAKLLKQTIKSVLKQQYQSWELIIVDDGSTDETKEVVFSFDDPRICYFYQENKERSAARNLGIHQAKGQYICFLDDDDYFLPDHLEIIAQRIKKVGYPVAIFRTGMISKYEKKKFELLCIALH